VSNVPTVCDKGDVLLGWSTWSADHGVSNATFDQGLKLIGLDWEYYAHEGYAALERAARAEPIFDWSRQETYRVRV
jgi:hypothetical protein